MVLQPSWFGLARASLLHSRLFLLRDHFRLAECVQKRCKAAIVLDRENSFQTFATRLTLAAGRLSNMTIFCHWTLSLPRHGRSNISRAQVVFDFGADCHVGETHRGSTGFLRQTDGGKRAKFTSSFGEHVIFGENQLAIAADGSADNGTLQGNSDHLNGIAVRLPLLLQVAREMQHRCMEIAHETHFAPRMTCVSDETDLQVIERVPDS